MASKCSQQNFFFNMFFLAGSYQDAHSCARTQCSSELASVICDRDCFLNALMPGLTTGASLDAAGIACSTNTFAQNTGSNFCAMNGGNLNSVCSSRMVRHDKLIIVLAILLGSFALAAILPIFGISWEIFSWLRRKGKRSQYQNL